MPSINVNDINVRRAARRTLKKDITEDIKDYNALCDSNGQKIMTVSWRTLKYAVGITLVTGAIIGRCFIGNRY